MSERELLLASSRLAQIIYAVWDDVVIHKPKTSTEVRDLVSRHIEQYDATEEERLFVQDHLVKVFNLPN